MLSYKKTKGELDMKALILTVTAGQGHNSTAAALHDKLTEKGIECRTVDACYQINKFLGFTVSKGYLLSVDRLSGSYANVYEKLEKRHPSQNSPALLALSFLAPKIGDYINDFSPDVIVCTHVFAALIVSELKRRKMLTAKTFGIVTDFTVHPYWEEVTNLDHIVVASERLEWQCRKKGFKAKQILPFGIPINKKFEACKNKAEAKKELGFFGDKPLITVMSGSMGYGSVSDTVKRIDKLKKCFQVAVVCGSNTSEYERLSEKHFKHRIKVYGYTDKISTLMDGSDCIITKPGGISVSEALSKALPMILNRPIPGHEERNLMFLLNCGVAMAVSKNCPIEEILWQFLSDSELRCDMSRAAKRLGKTNASERLADFILNM